HPGGASDIPHRISCTAAALPSVARGPPTREAGSPTLARASNSRAKSLCDPMRIPSPSFLLIVILLGGLARLGLAGARTAHNYRASVPPRPVMELGLGHSGRIQAIAWRRDGIALATA